MTTVTTYSELKIPAAKKEEPDGNLCGTCGKNPVYIGTMCRPCYEERAYPDREPPRREVTPVIKRLISRLPDMCSCCNCVKRYCICSCCCGK